MKDKVIKSKVNGKASKDVNKINRHKLEADKQRGMMKTGVNLSNETVDRIISVGNKEYVEGVYDICKNYKGNRLCNINRFLYDTRLQPKERLCYKYSVTPIACEGWLRDKKRVSVRYVDKPNDIPISVHKPFIVEYGEIEFKCKNQKEVVNKIKAFAGIKY